MSTRVDTAWYLATYPDVADSGIDPLAHFHIHGVREGRLPRELEAVRMEQALWAGFSMPAMQRLRQLCGDADDHERGHACYALSRWHAERDEWDEACRLADAAIEAVPGLLRRAGTLAYYIRVLQEQGRYGQIRQITENELENAATPSAELHLALAGLNVFTSSTEDAHADRSASVRELLNALFLQAGMSAIDMRDPDRPFCLDNLTTGAGTQAAGGVGGSLDIIVPACNAQATLGTTLHGLSQQTLARLRIVVVDDASTDATLEIASEHARHDPRIRVLPLKVRHGAYGARNAALPLCESDYLTVHDADDWSHPERYARVVQALNDAPDAIGAINDWVRVRPAFQPEGWRHGEPLVHPSVATLVYRREALRRLGGWDLVKAAADTEHYERTLQVHGKDAIIRVLPDYPLVFARKSANSLSNHAGTGRMTTYYGARKDYFLMSREGLRNLSLARLAPYPRLAAPASLLIPESPVLQHQIVLIGELSAVTQEEVQALLRFARRSGPTPTVGIFHWPDFSKDPLSTPSPALGAALRAGRLDVIEPGDELRPEYLILYRPASLRSPLDRAPIVRFRHLVRVDSLQELGICQPATANTSSAPRDDFDPDWYLLMHPDVRREGADPRAHFEMHGRQEGRLPGAVFSLSLDGLPDRADAVPAITGAQGRQTVMLCLHSADEQVFGAERSAIELAACIIEAGYRLVVAMPDDRNEAYVRAFASHNVAIVTIPALPWTADRPVHEPTLRAYLAAIREYGVDLVHVNTIMLREPLLAARRAVIPCIAHVREMPRSDPALCEFIGCSAGEIVESVKLAADYIFANSEFTAGVFHKDQSTFVVPNFVAPCEDLAPLPGLADESFTVAIFSSNQAKKGIGDIPALSELLLAHESIRLRVYGPDTPCVAQLRHKQTDGLHLQNVEFRGYVAAAYEVMHEIDAVLSISRFEETFGRTVLEAMHAARPVVAYEAGAIPELVRHQTTGLLVPQGNIESIAAAIISLANDRRAAAQMGRTGRTLARTAYGEEKTVDCIRTAYREILFADSPR